MRQDKSDRAHVALYLLGLLPVVWLALLLAPYLGNGLAAFLSNAPAVFENPFHIVLCEDSLKAALIFILCYGMGIGIYLSSDRN